MATEAEHLRTTGSNKGATFVQLSTIVSKWVGSSWMFLSAVAGVIAWGVMGPFFHFSDTWQLVVNTATTIVTFLMVFLIQNTQNRDARAVHLKLDEIIRSIGSARNEMIDIERLTDKELEELGKQYERVREECDLRRQSLEMSGKSAAPALSKSSPQRML